MPKKKEVKHEVSEEVVAGIPVTSNESNLVKHDWAVNGLKLNRAIASLQAAKKLNPEADDSEDALKAEYVKLGGAVR